MSKDFTPVTYRGGSRMQREDLTVNLTVDLFLESRCLHLPSYPCGVRR